MEEEILALVKQSLCSRPWPSCSCNAVLEAGELKSQRGCCASSVCHKTDYKLRNLRKRNPETPDRLCLKTIGLAKVDPVF